MHLRAKISTRPNPPINSDLMLPELDYVDDCDFEVLIDCETMKELTNMLPIIETNFGKWNLIENPTKTEFVNYKLFDHMKERRKERWRKPVNIRSLSCPKN